MVNKGDKYDEFVNEEVIFTTWNNIKQHVKIIKNDKINERLEVIGINNNSQIHYLVYKNIGEGCAVIKIEKKN